MTEAGLTLAAPVDGDAALNVALAWLREPPWPKGDGSLAARVLGTPDATDSLAVRMEAAGLKDWSTAIRTSTHEAGEPREADRRIQWLLSLAALDLAQAADHPQLFELIDDLQSLTQDTGAVLADALCARLGALSHDNPLLRAFEARLQSIYGSRFYERLRQYEEAASGQPLTTRDLWPGPAEWPMGDDWVHRVIAALSPARYMQILANFPAPFQHATAYTLTPIEIRVAAALIAASPPVFSEQGNPIGPTVIFGLLEEIEEALTGKVVDNLEAAALLDLDCILDALFARPEGAWIGRAWLQQTVWRGARRRAGRSEIEMEARSKLDDALLQELSRRMTPLGASQWNWVRAEEPLWQVNRVLAEAAVAQVHGNPQGAAEILAEAVTMGLVSATGRPEGLVTSTAEAKIVGAVLAGIPDPLAWFQDLWRATYDLREHLSFQAHRNLNNPAYPALTWALHGFNVSIGRSGNAAEFWQILTAALAETQLIDPNAELANGAVSLICRMTVRLGATLTERGVLLSADLADFMANQLEPDLEHAVLWRILRSAASDPTALDIGHFVGASKIRQAVQAALADGATRKWNAVFDQAGRVDLLDFTARLGSANSDTTGAERASRDRHNT